MKKHERILVVAFIFLILPILVNAVIIPASAEQSPGILVPQSDSPVLDVLVQSPDVLVLQSDTPVMQDEENEVDTSGDYAVVLRDEPVPLAAGADPVGWALLNLLFTIAGTIMALVICIHVLAKKQRALSDDKVKSGKIKPLQFLLAPFFAVAGIVLFALTQDVGTRMIASDGLTVAHATIFICTVLSSVTVYRSEKNGDGLPKGA